MRKFSSLSSVRGFTLVEAVMVIVITGIIGAVVAVFIKKPVDSYFDMARRADLTDVADTAVRRMSRDLRLALSNSVRNPTGGSDQCIEFIPTKIGGRYRAAVDATGAGDILDFTTTDAGFDMLWPNSALPAASQITTGDVIVVYNDGSTSGDAYSGSNAIKVDTLGAGGTANSTAINFVDAATGAPFNRKTLPSESPANRFQVIPAATHVLAYGCSGNVLTRYSRTLGAVWTQPATCAAMTAGATAAILARNVTSCSLKYDPPGASTGLGRFGIVSMSLEMTDSGESVKLYNQVHVDNTP